VIDRALEQIEPGALANVPRGELRTIRSAARF